MPEEIEIPEDIWKLIRDSLPAYTPNLYSSAFSNGVIKSYHYLSPLLAEKEAKIIHLQDGIDAADDMIKEKNESLVEKDERYADLQKLSLATMKVMAELLAEKDKEIEELKKELYKKDVEISAHENIRRKLHFEINKLLNTYKQL